MQKQKETYKYIMEKCETHWMPNKKLFTAHITLSYDYQKYGESEWEAKDTLATYLSTKKDIQDKVSEMTSGITI